MFTLNNITEQRGVGVALLAAMMKLGREKQTPLMRAIVISRFTRARVDTSAP